MRLLTRARSTIAALVVVPMFVVGLLWAVPGPSASASGAPTGAVRSSDPQFPIDYIVNASTTLAKLNETVTVPPGKFIGDLDVVTGKLTGNLTLPPAKTTFTLAGIGLATATFKISPTHPVTGTVNLKTLAVKATASFNVLIPSVYPLGLPINIVGNSCGTSKPVSVTFSGKFSFGSSSKFSGSYTIPPLSNCGLPTLALNLLIPGPGNTFSASFAPAPS